MVDGSVDDLLDDLVERVAICRGKLWCWNGCDVLVASSVESVSKYFRCLHQRSLNSHPFRLVICRWLGCTWSDINCVDPVKQRTNTNAHEKRQSAVMNFLYSRMADMWIIDWCAHRSELVGWSLMMHFVAGTNLAPSSSTDEWVVVVCERCHCSSDWSPANKPLSNYWSTYTCHTMCYAASHWPTTQRMRNTKIRKFANTTFFSTAKRF